MNESQKKIKGYVYILEVKDIDLPVCKIGMTSRNAYDRCAEINNSSTGDFIWEVAYQVSVDDCKSFEALVHKKLEPLRQRKREFFNINADIAHKALRSILESQSNIKEITIETEIDSTPATPKKTKTRKVRDTPIRKIDSEYTEILRSFTLLTNSKGRPFGQLNKPFFGMSDGNKGVQWNIVVLPETQEVKLGVNLEGLTYINWPIATFILNELRRPAIEELKNVLEDPGRAFVRFTRDAWQVTSRPNIVEQHLIRLDTPISEIDPTLWHTVLSEALNCLDETRGYRGRAEQVVTLSKKPRNGARIRSMEVSPHLIIRTPINLSGDVMENLRDGVKLLEPVHNWVTKTCQ